MKLPNDTLALVSVASGATTFFSNISFDIWIAIIIQFLTFIVYCYNVFKKKQKP
jgi:hypothetical protein